MAQSQKSLRAVFSVILSVLMALMLFCVPNSASAATINKSSVTITKGYSTTLKVSGASSVTWSSSNSKVAKVSKTGKVTAKKAGTATITAKTGSQTLQCKVTVVACSLSAVSAVNVDKGSSKTVTITVKGDTSLSYKVADKKVATAKWATSTITNKKAKLKITGVGEGTTTVKVYNRKYPSIAKTITVSVESLEEDNAPSLDTSVSNLSVKTNETATFTVTSEDGDALNWVYSDSTVASHTVGTFASNKATVTVKGLKVGTTTLTITNKNDSTVSKKVNITVTEGTGSGYYAVYDNQNIENKLIATDSFIQFYDRNRGINRYVLVPANNVDSAQVNTAIAKATNSYETYMVYSDNPTKTTSTDTVRSFQANITETTVNNGAVSTATKSVTRYVLLPQNYDEPQYNWVAACYIGTYDYGVIYTNNPLTSTNPTFKKRSADDKIYQYSTNKNGMRYTRYIVYNEFITNDPANYYSKVISKDGDAVTGAYYTVFNSVDAANAAKTGKNDQVKAFTANNVTFYILLPANYEEARFNSAVAPYYGQYEYNKIYANNPEKRFASDYVYSYTKTVNGKAETHYIMYPDNMNYTAQFNELKAKDLGTQYSAYYTAYQTNPQKQQDSDVIRSWINQKTNAYNYCLMPANGDILKYNDIRVANGGSYEYYHIYSNAPQTTGYDTYAQRQYTANGYDRFVYIYLPNDYDEAKINEALSGKEVF